MYFLFCCSALIIHVLAGPTFEDEIITAEMRYVL